MQERDLRRVILASSLGTLFEWYDFYLYGSLAVFFGELFFPPGNERAARLASLATFGAGFGVRPLFLPLIATAVTTSAWAKDRFGASAIYTGLAYPIAVCLMTIVVGGLFIRETKDHRIDTPIR